MFKLPKVVTTVFALISALLIFICNVNEGPPKANFYKPVSTQSFTLIDALTRAQGIANDGKSYYFSFNYGLIKTALDGTTIEATNYLAIPPKLLLLGDKHIGGLTYYKGKIYAPIEDSSVFQHLYICTYDAATLKFIAAYALPLANQEFGVPWCVADPVNGYIYSARRDDITTINCYDPDTLQLVKTIEINSPISKIQGGDMYKGILYFSVSREDQGVYAVNLKTGEVQEAFPRNLVDGAEGEGMTIIPTADGALFHVLDVAKDTLGVHLRNYAFDVNSIDWQLS
jgi:hypothetical protein